MCNSCATIHRGMGSHISRIKSVKLDNWDRTQVSCMEENGNEKVRLVYEKHLPEYYRRPKQSDTKLVLVEFLEFSMFSMFCSFSTRVVREQFIRAKYERREFSKTLDTEYSKGDLAGMLMKRGKEDGKFLPRKFILDHQEGTLKYFVKQVRHKL